MPVVTVKDGNGDPMTLHEFGGEMFSVGPFCDLDLVLPGLRERVARTEDVVIVAYPKSGTHWVWEICQLLLTGSLEFTKTSKQHFMLEFLPQEQLDSLPSPRVLNTHVKPDLFPKDWVKRKSKIIFVVRNPKDAFVSLYYHLTKVKSHDYGGKWDGMFPMTLAGKNVGGSWFEYMKSWEEFIAANPDTPVLRLCYEDMKQDLRTNVDRIADFLGVTRDATFKEQVAEKCDFSAMKDGKPIAEHLRHRIKGTEHPIFRKGVIGDWKNHFTVAQNEQFNEEYKNKRRGLTYPFESFM